MGLYRCPYCFHRFKKEDTLFRCQSIPQICPGVEDKVYNETHHETLPVQGRLIRWESRGPFSWPYSFNKQASASCPVCAHTTSQAVCPRCHHNLPLPFLQSQVITLGFICQRPQEMEAFLVHLRKMLEKTVAHDLGYILCPNSYETKRDIILQRVEARQSFLERLLGKHSSHLIVRFYPLGPEEFSNVLRLDGIILFCDKLNAEEGRSYVPDVLYRLIGEWSKKRENLSEKFPTPLGIVYNCFESLEPLLPKTHPLFFQGGHHEGYNEKDGARISSEMLAYTGYWFGANVLQTLKTSFRTYRLFCQSFVYPEVQPFMPHAGWRVEDSFLWMLKTLGYLRTHTS